MSIMASPEDMMKLVRETFPSQVVATLKTEFPMVADPIERKLVQEVEVYDPRNRIHETAHHPDKVLVVRVVKSVPVQNTGNLVMVPSRVIEVLREYTFEEWDSGLTQL